MEVLDDEKRCVIRLQSDLVGGHQFYLAGGTGLGLRLGHRLSRDVDWFTRRLFDVAALAQRLQGFPEKPTDTRVQGPDALRVYYGRFETSFLHYYRQVAAHPAGAARADEGFRHPRLAEVSAPCRRGCCQSG